MNISLLTLIGKLSEAVVGLVLTGVFLSGETCGVTFGSHIIQDVSGIVFIPFSAGEARVWRDSGNSRLSGSSRVKA